MVRKFLFRKDSQSHAGHVDILVFVPTVVVTVQYFCYAVLHLMTIVLDR